jgi:pyridine nucleotide-disulfide oxidoreductase
VILALGKTGSPRKLCVKGEEFPKVMYRLIEADHYVNKKILIVGGDSTVEAAIGLAHQVGNTVTLSYRPAAFTGIKERNALRIQDCIRKGKLKVLFHSNPLEFRPIAPCWTSTEFNKPCPTILSGFFRRGPANCIPQEDWSRLRRAQLDERRAPGSDRNKARDTGVCLETRMRRAHAAVTIGNHQVCKL